MKLKKSLRISDTEILNNKFSIRQASDKDANKLQEIVFSVLEEYGLEADPSSTDKDLFEIESYYEDGYLGVVTDVETKEILGSFGLLELNNEAIELRKMYLLKKARGKGIGKYIVRMIIDKVNQSNYTTIELETASALKEAIGLYKRLGFVEKQFEHQTPRCDKAFTMNF